MQPSWSDERGFGSITRRGFIAAAALPVLAAACSRRKFDPRAFALPSRSAVGLFAAGSYDIDLGAIIGRGLRELGVDVRGKRVFLKPNIVEYEPGTAINTNPLVVAGAIAAFRRAGAASVIVGEGPGHRRDTEYLVTRTGLYDHLRDDRVEFVDLNEDDVSYVQMRSGYTGIPRIALPVSLLQSDFVVSMPKLKTHHWAGMTASMKNFFGAVPGAVYGWPKNILHMHGVDNSILDLNATIRPRLTIVDAITAMEGNGPIMGRERHAGFIAMSQDVVAADATCARAMGLDPAKLPYLREGARYLGNIDLDRIDQRGEPLSPFASTFDVIDLFKPYRLG